MAEVEPSSDGDAPPSTSELEYRLRQQRILADFGIEALRSRDFDKMLARAAELCADGMQTRLSKILEYQDNPERLYLRAGVGWRPGLVGEIHLGTDLESPAGFALKTGESVISNHLQEETRFRTPAFMAEHAVKRAINVLIEVDGKRFGVLEVDSRNEGSFEAADLSFMQGFASLIGVAIDRQRAEARLQQAIEHQELLTREASHRVKNSLTMVSSMLALQMSEQDDPEITRVLSDAQARIVTIAQAHDQLWRGNVVGLVDMRDLGCDLAERLAEQSPAHTILCDIDPMMISADTAIPLGLFLTEATTNAIKYAYPDAGGTIAIGCSISNGRLTVTIADHGAGLPDGFDPTQALRKSLGMRMIGSLARQLGGTLTFEDNKPGVLVRLDMPDPRD